MSSLINAIAETVRRKATDDAWYVENKPYVLELRAPPTAALITGVPVTYMVLPLGLQQYTVKRVFRQSVTPTLGGLVAEEQGELWKEIHITWDPGLQAKRSIDISQLPSPNPSVFGLSGPGWSRRLLYNYFDNYAKLKADPSFARSTYLIWHDMKFDEHFVVVPSDVTVERVTSKRMRYPIEMSFISIGTPDGVLPDLTQADILSTKPPRSVNAVSGFAALANGFSLPKVSKFATLLAKIRGAISDINRGLSMVSAAVQRGSATLGDVRLFAATIDQILTNMDIIVKSASDFKDGVTSTLSIGRLFVTSTATLLDDAMALIEGVADMPDAIRQNYMMAADGLNAIAANRAAFGESYSTVADRQAASELGPTGRATEEELNDAETRAPPQTSDEVGKAGVDASSRSLRDAGALPSSRVHTQYTSFLDYVVKATDTIHSIAASKLNDGALWYDIAIANGLKSPYLSQTAMPDTAQPGDRIKIPVTNSAIGSDKVDQSDSIYFTDMAWVETGQSLPGVPRVTLAVDKRSFTDVKVVTGIKNMTQALQLRHWTERGTVPLAPGYGLRRLIGSKLAEGSIEIIRLNFRENILADPRVRVVKRVTVTVVSDQVDLEADIIPIGETDSQTIRAVVV